MYINEVGNSDGYHQNVLPRELGQNIHYYLHVNKPLKRGQMIELSVDSMQLYEKTRERKGYGLANLRGEILGDDDPATRLQRNIAERKEIAKIIYEMKEDELSRALYFLINSLFEPVMNSLKSFLNNAESSTASSPHPRQCECSGLGCS